jgi:hypothetical protein
MVGWLVNSDLERIWKEAMVTYLKYYPGSVQTSIQDGQYHAQDLNPSPTKCKTGVLQLYHPSRYFSRSDTHHAEGHNPLPMLYILYRILHGSYGDRLIEYDLVWSVSGLLVGLINNGYWLSGFRTRRGASNSWSFIYPFNGFSSPFRPRPLLQFRNNFFTDGRTPWTSDQPVARPLPTHRTTQTQNKRTQTSMPRVGFEPTIPASKRATTVHALDRGANVTGQHLYTAQAIVYVRVLVFAAKRLVFIISLSVNPVADVRDITTKIVHTGRELLHLFSVYQGVSAFGGRPPGSGDRGRPGLHQQRFVRHSG